MASQSPQKAAKGLQCVIKARESTARLAKGSEDCECRDGRRRATCDVVQPFAGQEALRRLRFAAFCSLRYLFAGLWNASQRLRDICDAFAGFRDVPSPSCDSDTQSHSMGVGGRPRCAFRLRHRVPGRANAAYVLALGADGQGTERSNRRGVGDRLAAESPGRGRLNATSPRRRERCQLRRSSPASSHGHYRLTMLPSPSCFPPVAQRCPVHTSDDLCINLTHRILFALFLLAAPDSPGSS